MKTLEMKIAIPEVNGGECVSAEIMDDYILVKYEIEESEISDKELECRIDPNSFAGAWLQHQPTTRRQEDILTLYQKAKAEGRLHAFTCMTVAPSVKDGKLVYQKGLPSAKEVPHSEWESMLYSYKRRRNSRMMSLTEYACKKLFRIQKLVEDGYEIAEAWELECSDFGRNTVKFLAEDDPKHDSIWYFANVRNSNSEFCVTMEDCIEGVGEIALD